MARPYNREILEHTGLEKAVGLIIPASSAASPEVVEAARDLNPKIRIVTRSNNLKENAALLYAGAEAIFSSEGEIALSMTAFLMSELGASDEQVDRERDRVRKELFAARQDSHATNPATPTNAPATKKTENPAPNLIKAK